VLRKAFTGESFLVGTMNFLPGLSAGRCEFTGLFGSSVFYLRFKRGSWVKGGGKDGRNAYACQWSVVVSVARSGRPFAFIKNGSFLRGTSLYRLYRIPSVQK